jgi:tripartite-type tricarboxylate transporter receptor subunit TctC
MKLKIVFAYAAAAISLITAGVANADNFSSKAIRSVVPFPPGGTDDILARAVGAELNKFLGHSVIIDNRLGARGNIGSEIVAKRPGDVIHC